MIDRKTEVVNQTTKGINYLMEKIILVYIMVLAVL